MGVQRQSKREYMARMQGRYLKATKREKGALLDEVVAVTGYHRRHAVRVLRHGRFPDPKLAPVQGTARRPGRRRRAGRAPGRPRVYSSVVVGALRVAAEASNWLCGTRLAPFLPELVPALEAEGALRLDARGPGAAAGDERAHHRPAPAPFRLQRDPRNWHGLGTTKPGTLLKDQVPVQTYTPWEEQRPGFVEIDLVAHCGPTTEGFYLNTLVVDRRGDRLDGVRRRLGQEPAGGLRRPGDGPPAAADAPAGPGLRQRQRVPQRPPGALLHPGGAHLHPQPAVLEERPGPRRAEELVGRAQARRLRALRERGRPGPAQPRVRPAPDLDQLGSPRSS